MVGSDVGCWPVLSSPDGTGSWSAFASGGLVPGPALAVMMIVTPYLFRARGYQHPALHLRKLTPFGVFECFAGQFEQVWGTVRIREILR